MDGVIEGRIVHYVAYNQRCLAGMIIGHAPDGVCDLVVFTNLPNVNGVKNFGTQFHQDVAYDGEKNTPGSWHFPERV